MRTGVAPRLGMPPSTEAAWTQMDMVSPASFSSASTIGFLMMGGVTVKVTLTDSPESRMPVVVELNDRSQLIGLVVMPAVRTNDVGAFPSFWTLT